MIFYLLNSLTTSNRDATDIVVLAAFGQPHTNRARGGGVNDAISLYGISPLLHIVFFTLGRWRGHRFRRVFGNTENWEGACMSWTLLEKHGQAAWNPGFEISHFRKPTVDACDVEMPSTHCGGDLRVIVHEVFVPKPCMKEASSLPNPICRYQDSLI